MSGRMARRRAGSRQGLASMAAGVAVAALAGVTAVPLATSTPAAADPGPLVLEAPESVAPRPLGSVPIDAIPPTVLEALPELLPSAPLGSIPLGSIPLGSIPLGSIPLGSIPLGSIPLGSIPLGSIPLGSIPLGSIGGWEAALDGVPELDRPPLTVTLGELIAYVVANPGSPLASITIDDLDVAHSPLGSISLASLALGALPLGSIPLDGEAATVAARMALWCDALAPFDVECAPDGPITASSTVLTLDVLGAPLGSIPLGSIPLGSIPLGSIPLGSIPLGSIPLGSIPLGSIPLGSIPLGSIPLGSIPLGSIPLGSIGTIADCGLVSCTTGTLADAQAAGALVPTTVAELVAAFAAAGIDVTLAQLEGGWPDDVTFGDLLFAIVDPADYPWEDLPLADLGLLQYTPYDEEINGLSETHTATFGTGGPAVFDDAELRIELSGNHRFLVDAPHEVIFDPPFPGSDYEITVTGPTLLVEFGPVPAGTTATVHVGYAPGIEERVGSMDATLTAEGFETSTSTELAPEPGEEDHFNAQPDQGDFMGTLEPGLLWFMTAGPGDVDYFKVPAPPAGYRLSVHVGGLGGDTEVGLYQLTPDGVLAGEPNPLGIGGTPQTEQARDGIAAAGALTGDPAGDLTDQGAVLIASSDHEGLGSETVSAISTGDTAQYLVRVAASGALTDRRGYMVRARHVPIAAETTCAARTLPLAGEGTQGTAPASLPAGVNTVFLINQDRLGDSYGAAEQAATLAALQSLAGRADLGVVGAVVPVDGSAAVRSAYAGWDANPCSVSGANTVVSSIGTLLDGLVAASPGAAESLRSVVLVGADDLLPMARVPDLTRVANEVSYAGDLRTDDGAATPLSAAADTRHLLTDDPYGDHDPIPWLERFLYVPDRAVGRLVEQPAEIRAALAQFEASGGVLDASTALTTGYDFLEDGADAVDDGLGRRLPGAQRSTLNPETWDRDDLDDALFPSSGETPDIASVNAHYDHSRLLPGVPEPYGDGDLYTTADLAAGGFENMLGKLLFTMGCHGGTNVPDIYVGTTDPDRLDWAQAVAGNGGSYVANTGFGYGDSLTVALSERIMALFAERLDGNATIGQSLIDAKQSYLGHLGAYSNYDEKALMQVAFYGLPMYRLGPPTAPPLPPAPPAPATTVDPETGLQAASLTITPDFDEETAPDGTSFVTADGEYPQVSADRPLVPRTSLTFALDDAAPIRGVLITGLESTIETGVAASVAKPVVDDASHEPANRYDDVAFPSQLATVNQFRTAAGEQQALVLLPGRFVADDDPSTPVGTGTRELFTSVDVLAYVSGSPDVDGPMIVTTDAEIAGTQATFSVDAGDAAAPPDLDPVSRVLVLFRTPGGDWQPLDLDRPDPVVLPTQWSGTATVPAGTTALEWFVQAVDPAGNVAIDTNRGRLRHHSSVAPSFDAGGTETVSLGEPLRRTVTVTDPDSTRFTATVDWGNGPVPGTVRGNEIELTGLGTRLGTTSVVIEVCDDGGACRGDGFDIAVVDPTEDVLPPVVVGTPDRAPNVHGWYRAPVTITWTATDPAPSAGPATQPAPTVASTEGADVVYESGPSCDPLGQCATGSLALSIDRGLPASTITTGIIAPIRLLGGRFTGTAGDSLSGVDTVTVTYQPLLGAASTVPATLSCGSDRRSCTWSAPLPGTGLYTATVRVTDRAGNVRASGANLTIVLL